MRGRSNEHLVVTDYGEGHKAVGHDFRYVSACGEQFTWLTTRSQNDPDHWKVCRKCNAAFYAEAAASSGFRLGKTLTTEEMETWGQRWKWRYLVPVVDLEGREWGWCGLPGGWGERWEFVTWSPYAPHSTDELTGKIGAALTDGRGDPLKFSSKQAVLAKLPDLIAEHHIRDKASRVAEAVQARVQAAADRVIYEAEAAERAARRERQRAEEDQRRQEILEGLRSIRETFGAALSNFETAALVEAISKFDRGE